MKYTTFSRGINLDCLQVSKNTMKYNNIDNQLDATIMAY